MDIIKFLSKLPTTNAVPRGFPDSSGSPKIAFPIMSRNWRPSTNFRIYFSIVTYVVEHFMALKRARRVNRSILFLLWGSFLCRFFGRSSLLRCWLLRLCGCFGRFWFLYFLLWRGFLGSWWFCFGFFVGLGSWLLWSFCLDSLLHRLFDFNLCQLEWAGSTSSFGLNNCLLFNPAC